MIYKIKNKTNSNIYLNDLGIVIDPLASIEIELPNFDISKSDIGDRLSRGLIEIDNYKAPEDKFDTKIDTPSTFPKITKTNGDVAVVIPSHNYGKYLSETVYSIQNQTIVPCQIIIVDDSSTDNTYKIVKNLQIHYENLEYHHVDFKNAPETRNFGISKCKKTVKYVLMLDADNRISDHRAIEKMSGPLSDPRVHIVYCREQLIDENGKIIGNFDAIKPFDYYRLRRYNFIEAAALMKKEILLKDPYDKECSIMDDWALWLDLSRDKCGFWFIEEPLIDYRLHSNQLSKKNKFQDPNNIIEILKRHSSFLIVIPFSGRWVSLKNISKILNSIDKHYKNIHILIIDNSFDDNFKNSLKHFISSLQYPHTYIQYDEKLSDDVMNLTQSYDDMSKIMPKLSRHMAKIYSNINFFRPDFVWILEDDVEPLVDNSLSLLLLDMIQNDSDMVVGRVPERNIEVDNYLIAWNLSGPDNSFVKRVGHGKNEKIDGGTWGCTLIRGEIFDMPILMSADGRGGAYAHDIAVAASMKQLKKKSTLSSNVFCRHWRKNGGYALEKSLYPENVLKSMCLSPWISANIQIDRLIASNCCKIRIDHAENKTLDISNISQYQDGYFDKLLNSRNNENMIRYRKMFLDKPGDACGDCDVIYKYIYNKINNIHHSYPLYNNLIQYSNSEEFKKFSKNFKDNYNLCMEEIINRSVRLESIPIQCGFSFGLKCNASCIMCIQKAVRYAALYSDPEFKLSDEYSKAMFEFCANKIMPYVGVCGCVGGELFAYPESWWSMLMESARQNKNCRLCVTTNMVALTPDISEKYIDDIFSIHTSLDHTDAEKLYNIRKGVVLEDFIRNSITIRDICKKKNIHNKLELINVVLLPHNYDNIYKIIYLCEELDIKNILISQFIPTGCDNDYEFDILNVSYENRVGAFRNISDAIDRSSINVLPDKKSIQTIMFPDRYV